MKINEPYVVKIRWAIPGSRNAGQGSAANVQYIATRPGVALDRAHQEDADQQADHLRYMHERPRSLGLFGQDPEHRPDLDATMSELRATSSPTWRIIVSLREDDAQTLGVVGLPAWQDLTRRIMPGYARALGVRVEDLRWVAAHHPESGHPHVHVMAWVADGTQSRRAGLNREELRDVQRCIAKEIYGPMRAEIAAQKTAERDALVQAGRANIQEARDALRQAQARVRAVEPEAAPLAPRFREPQLDALGQRLSALADRMPGHGRAVLAYQPEDVREEARAIADWALQQPQLAEALRRYQGAARDLASLYTGQSPAQQAAADRADADLRDRVAQAAVKAAASIQGERERMILRSLAPAQAVAHVAGVTLDDAEARAIADLLRRVEIGKDDRGRPVAQGPAAQQTVDSLMARAPQGTSRSKVKREVGIQARRLQGAEAQDRQWAARAGAQGVLHAAHSTLHREYQRAQAKAELAQAKEVQRIEEQGKEALEEGRPRKRGHDHGMDR